MKNEISRNVFKEVIGFDSRCKERGGAKDVDGSTMWLVQLDAWISSIVDCLTERKRRGGHRKKLYSGTSEKNSEMVAEQLAGNTPLYVNFCLRMQILATPDQDIGNRFVIQSTKERLLTLNGAWFRKYVSDMLKRVSDFYVPKVGCTEWRD